MFKKTNVCCDKGARATKVIRVSLLTYCLWGMRTVFGFTMEQAVSSAGSKTDCLPTLPLPSAPCKDMRDSLEKHFRARGVKAIAFNSESDRGDSIPV